MVVLAVTWMAKVGRESEVAAIFEKLSIESRKEPGCLMYQVHKHKTDPRRFFVYEQYKDGAALEAHSVDHSVAREPVGGGLARVGTVTQVPAVDLGRDGTLDRQVVVGQFVGHRRVIPLLEEQSVGGQVGGVGCDVGHVLTLTVQI